MQTHIASVRSRRIAWDVREVVQHGLNADRIKFDLDAEFRGCDSYQVVLCGPSLESPKRYIPDKDMTVAVPPSLMESTGPVSTCLLGYVGGEVRVVTAQERYPLVVVESGFTGPLDPGEEQPDLWAQIMSAEAARIEAELVREAAETARADAEAKRIAAEKARETASAEAVKAANEAAAKAEQAARQAEDRVTAAIAEVAEAEQARTEAESARAAAESKRESAEAKRKADSAKAVADASAATSAANAAAGKADAAAQAATDGEASRVAAETARAKAEQARVTAEEGRVEAEMGRVDDAARLQAETRRTHITEVDAVGGEAASASIEQMADHAKLRLTLPRGPEGKPGDWGVRDGEVYLEENPEWLTWFINGSGTITQNSVMSESCIYKPVRIPDGIETIRFHDGDGGEINQYMCTMGWSSTPDLKVYQNLESPIVKTKRGWHDVPVPKAARWAVIVTNTNGATGKNDHGEAPRLFIGANRPLDALNAAADLKKRVDKLDGSATENSVRISLPKEFKLVVGDRFELFWKGCVQAQDPYRFGYRVACDIGSAYRRFFTATPTAAGSHQLKVELLDDDARVLSSAVTTLRVVEKPSAPSATRNVLCVGDSLLASGRWASEAHRRLTQSGGSPAGLGVGNVDFIGGMKVGSCGFEGNGGWMFDSYNKENKLSGFSWVTCAGHGKSGADQHSVYRDANGAEWKVETIEESRIKMIRVKGSTPMPASGTLTWVSGGENHGAITFTASEMAAGNPFWDAEAGKVDFAKYAQRMGASSIDYVYVLLGWNSTWLDAANYEREVKTFVGNVHAAYPNCRVALLGLQVPSQDGMAENYGCKWPYLPNLKHVFDRNELYEKIAGETEHCEFVNIAAQFDTENNMQEVEQPVNSRSDKKELRQNNGVHPDIEGYDQIADAVFRDLCSALK